MAARDEKNVRPAHHANHAAPAGRGSHAAGGSARASHARTGARRAARQSPQGLASDSSEISTIGAGQGARVTTRKNAAEAADRARQNAEKRYAKRHPEARAAQGGPERSVRNIVLLVIAGILVVAVVFAVGSLINALLFPPATEETAKQEQTLRPSDEELAAQEEQAEHDAGHEQAGVDGTVSYAGETYSLQQGDDGAWSLVNSAGEALVALEGTPVALVRTGDTLLVPENRDGGWDVPCYVVGGHTQGTTYVVGSDGNPVQGSGDIASVDLDGTTLRVTGADGSTTDVALA